MKDYDIFCRSRKAIKRLITYFDSHPEVSCFRTENAITVGKYQFVLKHIGDPEVEVAKFDFLHNCYYYDCFGLHAVFGWEHINSNKLKFNHCRARDVLNILTRIPKFLDRGMDITKDEILKIIEYGTRPMRIIGERRSVKAQRKGRIKY